MGAWIEIGLRRAVADSLQSLPSWERGLKLCRHIVAGSVLPVAPLVGAWIEIEWRKDLENYQKVAPLVGAWIEIFTSSLNWQNL